MKLRVLSTAGVLLFVTLFLVRDVAAGPRLGRAVIAGVEGAAQIETEEGTFDAEMGGALSHGHAIVAGDGASVCALLTPGALMCVHANSRVELEVLEHATEGLPAEGKPAMGRIALKLERGAILLNGLKGPEGIEIGVTLAPGVVVKLSRAECILAKEKGGWSIFVERGEATLGAGTEQHQARQGQKMRVASVDGGGGAPWAVTITDGLQGRDEYNFYVCRELFPSLEPLAADWSWDKLDEAGDIVADGARIALITRPATALDVSPSTRDQADRRAATPPPAVQVPGEDEGVRPRVEMWQWYQGIGTVRGFNYLPRNAVNATEMWQGDTYTHPIIDEEFGWAHDSGFTSVRVFLPFLVWQQDAKGFKNRLSDVLALADKHALSVVPVMFDDYSPQGLEPYLGPQHEPVAGVYNSQWTPSPGHARVKDRQEWPALENYVRDIVGSFSGDKRIVFWDLYNEPGRSGMGDDSLPLVNAAFDWARQEHPAQPLTAGVSGFMSPAALTEVMRRSDLVTFSGHKTRANLEASMAVAGLRGRPVICTGWLDRTRDLTYDQVLPLFAEQHVGWYQWGLVAGRSQLQLPPESGETAAPGVWAQALLKEDGKPYDDKEVQLIRQFLFEER